MHMHIGKDCIRVCVLAYSVTMLSALAQPLLQADDRLPNLLYCSLLHMHTMHI